MFWIAKTDMRALDLVATSKAPWRDYNTAFYNLHPSARLELHNYL